MNEDRIDDLVREGLRDLDLWNDPQIEGEWQFGFCIARRIYKVLFDADIVDVTDYGPDRFVYLVQDFYRNEDWNEDLLEMITAQFWDAWGMVALPEGYDPLDFCYKLALFNGRYKHETDISDAYPTENQMICTQLTLTTARILQEMFGECFISSRAIAYWLARTTVEGKRLKCNHQTATVILRRLVSEGALEILIPATSRRAARFRYVPAGERIPKVDRGLQRIQRIQKTLSVPPIEPKRAAANDTSTPTDIPEGIPPGRARHYSKAVTTSKPDGS